ncbi:hypothetical protein EDB87DRAFT_1608932 [Lactarius vividus]|nr:hypothetical protein EDB87DRAFT_1608932 [Lactarius vividus]
MSKVNFTSTISKAVSKTPRSGPCRNGPRTQEFFFVWLTGFDTPMFIVRHKDTPLDGTAPAIQYGYGGFSISIGSFFSSSTLPAMRKYGFVLAVPNIRGGGEFGEEWHLAGTRERKVNCFDDFIAAS